MPNGGRSRGKKHRHLYDIIDASSYDVVELRANTKKNYRVQLNEVHISSWDVEAEIEHAAGNRVLDGEGETIHCDYSQTPETMQSTALPWRIKWPKKNVGEQIQKDIRTCMDGMVVYGREKSIIDDMLSK